MPSREYYLSDDPKMVAHRAAYRNYIVTIEKLAGLPGGEAAADRIIALETALSQAQWSAAERRDIDKTYNPMGRAQLAKLAPQFDWTAHARQMPDLQRRTGCRAASHRRSPGQARFSPRRRCRPGRNGSRSASSPITPSCCRKRSRDANFDFFSKELGRRSAAAGPVEARVGAVNGALGEAVGNIYVGATTRPSAERQMTRAHRQSARRLLRADQRQQLDGRSRRAKRRWTSSPRLTRASVTPSNISIIRRSRSSRATLSATRSAPETSSGSSSSCASPSRSTAACGE